MSNPFKEVTRFQNHNNAFGLIRLVLASLVIVAHTPELIDGDRSRELLTRLFGTLSFGAVAVDGFFVVSGYLIAGSYISNQGIINYLLKRIARIYPAFVMCSVFCIAIIAPLGGASIADICSSLINNIKEAIMLRPPSVPNVFVGTAHPVLNGAMWTISYEFRCYILVIILGITGIINRPIVILISAVAFMIAYKNQYINEYALNFRFASIFLVGVLFYIWRGIIVFKKSYVIISVCGLSLFMFSQYMAEPAFAIFGSYIIFSIASFGGSWAISQINNRDDISYGLYLYAWPVEKTILLYYPSINPLIAGTATFIVACAFGWISWHALEKRVMRLSMKWDAPKKLERKVSEVIRAVSIRVDPTRG